MYLRADLETLKKHIKKRGRPEEAHLDPEWLAGLQQCHEDWLLWRNSTWSSPAPKESVNFRTLMDK